MAAFDMADPKSVVSPGGVGFDINCGVRLLRTNLTEKDVVPLKEQLAQCLFNHIPVGVGSKGIIPMTAKYVNPLPHTLFTGSSALDKVHIFISITRIFSQNPMLDHLLESSH